MDNPPRTWNIVALHHVAFAHEGHEVAARLSDVLGLVCTAPEAGEGFVERMLPAGDAFLQLLEPTGPGVVGRFLERRGPGLHHVAFRVTDIDAALQELSRQGVPLVDAHARPGGGNTRIAFVHPSAFGGLLVELVETPTHNAVLS